MKGESRRQQIVEVAAELFSRRGFSGTTTKEIADHAGVSEAMIFRHFATKDALYSAILHHKVDRGIVRVEQRLKEAASRRDDRAFFGSLALEMLEFHTEDTAFMRLLFFSALEGHDLSKIFFDSVVLRVRRKLLRYIKQRIEDGAFRAGDPAVAARAFIGMLLYHVQLRDIFQNDELKLSNRCLADRFVELFLNGLRSLPAPARGRKPANNKSGK